MQNHWSKPIKIILYSLYCNEYNKFNFKSLQKFTDTKLALLGLKEEWDQKPDDTK